MNAGWEMSCFYMKIAACTCDGRTVVDGELPTRSSGREEKKSDTSDARKYVASDRRFDWVGRR